MMVNELAKKIKARRVQLNSFVKRSYLRALGVKVGKNVTFAGRMNLRFNGDPRRVEIQDGVTFLGHVDLRNRENGAIIIERGCYFDDGVRIVAARESTIRIGADTQAGLQFVINAGGNVTFGKKCLISNNVNINGSAHVTYRDEPIIDQGYVQGTVDVGDDVWLASCVSVQMNSRIGTGAIIGANSVVGGVVPEYSISLGSPAKVVGTRPWRATGAAAASLPLSAAPPLTKGVLRHSSAMDVLGEIRQAFTRALPGPLPSDSVKLRGGGLVDSLGWVAFMAELEQRLGVDMPADVAISPALDSFESLALYFAPPSQMPSTTLSLPEKPYHLGQRLAEFAKLSPKQRAISIRAEGQQAFQDIDYGTLARMAGQFAAMLRQEGVKPGERVGIVFPTSAELVAAFWGCIHAGVVPSIFAHPSSKVSVDIYSRSHAKIFSHAGLAAIYCQGSLKDRLKPLVGSEIRFLPEQAWKSLEPITESHSGALDDVALVQHSSGTTGLQKGVALSHRAISSQLTQYGKTLNLHSSDGIVSWLPLYHDMGLVACFLLPVMSGVPLTMLSPFDWIAQPVMLFDALQKYGGTLAWLPNFAFSVLARTVSRDRLRTLDLSAVKAFISCSETVSADTMTAFADKFAPAGVTTAQLWSCYAMAENTFAVTQAPYFKFVEIDATEYSANSKAKPKQGGYKVVSQGKPLPNVTVGIAGKSGEPLPEGMVGEVRLQSDCMLSGYFNNQEATAAAMRGGWYYTGDLGFVLDGDLYISGRKKDLIIVAGRNFYPQDIEMIVGSVEGVKAGRCAAFGTYSASKGTEDIVVVAERSEGAGRSAADIEADIKRVVFEQLDCVVNSVTVVEAGTIVKTSSGKVSRGMCREWYEAQASARS